MDFCRIKLIKTIQISLWPNFRFVLKSIYLQCDSSVFLSNWPLFQPIVVFYTKILFVLAPCHAAKDDIFKSNYLKIVQEAWSNVKISTCHLCYKIIFHHKHLPVTSAITDKNGDLHDRNQSSVWRGIHSLLWSPAPFVSPSLSSYLPASLISRDSGLTVSLGIGHSQ